MFSQLNTLLRSMRSKASRTKDSLFASDSDLLMQTACVANRARRDFAVEKVVYLTANIQKSRAAENALRARGIYVEFGLDGDLEPHTVYIVDAPTFSDHRAISRMVKLISKQDSTARVAVLTDGDPWLTAEASSILGKSTCYKDAGMRFAVRVIERQAVYLDLSKASHHVVTLRNVDRIERPT